MMQQQQVHEPYQQQTMSQQESMDQVLFTLQHAVWRGDTELVLRYLATHPVDLNALNAEGFAFLHVAAHREHLDLISLLLRRGAMVDVQSAAGDTALAMAARDGHREVAELLLLQAKPQPNLELENSAGYRPLELAVLHKKMEVAKLLIGHGAKIRTKLVDVMEKSGVDYSRETWHYVQLLQKGWDPLHVAIFRKSLADVRMLKSLGWQPINRTKFDVKVRQTRTDLRPKVVPARTNGLQLAQMYGTQQIVDLLNDRSPNSNDYASDHHFDHTDDDSYSVLSGVSSAARSLAATSLVSAPSGSQVGSTARSSPGPSQYPPREYQQLFRNHAGPQGLGFHEARAVQESFDIASLEARKSHSERSLQVTFDQPAVEVGQDQGHQGQEPQAGGEPDHHAHPDNLEHRGSRESKRQSSAGSRGMLGMVPENERVVQVPEPGDANEVEDDKASLAHSGTSSAAAGAPSTILNLDPATAGPSAPVYPYEDLVAGTSGFSDDNLLGGSPFSAVYKGKVHGTWMAVKKLKQGGDDGAFEGEVKVAGQLQHPNVVLLMGVCADEKCVVYEYMRGGSLQSKLESIQARQKLTLTQRLEIMLDVATAVAYLHSRPARVLHQCIKPSNILLDAKGNAKLSDVGMGKIMPMHVAISTRVQMSTAMARKSGLAAFLDPDYLQHGKFGRKSDVYSYGMCLIWILTGVSPNKSSDIRPRVEDALEENPPDIQSIVDPEMPQPASLSIITTAFKLALSCTHQFARRRPFFSSMDDAEEATKKKPIVEVLEELVEELHMSNGRE